MSLSTLFMFFWIEFWDMFSGVYLVPPRRPCLAAIMSNHHQFPISPAPPPTPPNQPSAKGRQEKGWKKSIKLFNVLNSLISSSDNHHEKISVIRATNFFSHRFRSFWQRYLLEMHSISLELYATMIVAGIFNKNIVKHHCKIQVIIDFNLFYRAQHDIKAISGFKCTDSFCKKTRIGAHESVHLKTRIL